MSPSSGFGRLFFAGVTVAAGVGVFFPSDFDDFFSNYSLSLGAEVPFPVGRAQQISLGAGAEISLYATPEPPRRNDFGAFIGYHVNLTRQLSLDAAGRVLLRMD